VGDDGAWRFRRLMAEWEELAPPWREVLLLMWEAYSAGTIPVGAVIVDELGEIVARGRNRIFDEPLDWQLGRSRLAHAELNALAALSSDRRYEGHTLYTALEPCHLCLSAAISVGVGRVSYAAADPYAGAAGKLVPSEDHLAHPIALEGPLPDVAGRLPELVHVAHMLWRVPEGGVVGFYRRRFPDVLAAAGRLPPPGARATFADVFATFA
jgi:tRNA(adenine34) deaminase